MGHDAATTGAIEAGAVFAAPLARQSCWKRGASLHSLPLLVSGFRQLARMSSIVVLAEVHHGLCFVKGGSALPVSRVASFQESTAASPGPGVGPRRPMDES